MAAASNYLENKLIDHIFRAASFTKPTALYVALFTAAPSDAGGGTEVTGGSYVRIDLPPADANWKATQGGVVGNSSGTSGATSNAATITYPAPTADWGSIGWYGIFDALSAGNLLVWGPLDAVRTILSGDPAASFAVDALDITIG